MWCKISQLADMHKDENHENCLNDVTLGDTHVQQGSTGRQQLLAGLP